MSEAIAFDTLNSNLDTKAGIEQLHLRTKTDLAELKADLLKWMIGALIAQGGLIVALVKLL